MIHQKRIQKRVEVEITRSYEMMYRLAYSYVYNPDDAMDIVQESAYKAIRYADQVQNEKYIKTWLCKIVINMSLDYLKTNQREVPVDQLYERDEPMTEDTYEDFDTIRALNILEEKEKTVVILRFFESRKLEEIAVIMEENQNTVKTWLYRALKKLRVELEKA